MRCTPVLLFVLFALITSCGSAPHQASEASPAPGNTDQAATPGSESPEAEAVPSSAPLDPGTADTGAATSSADDEEHHDFANVPGIEQHGRCCDTDDECQGLVCTDWPYAFSGCERVCRVACEEGARCPRPGGVFFDRGEWPSCEEGWCPHGLPQS